MMSVYIKVVEISQYQELQFSCEAVCLAGEFNQTTIRIVFYDETFSSSVEPEPEPEPEPVQVTGESTFSTYTSSAVVPPAAQFVDVQLYTTFGAIVSSCSLTGG